MLQSKKRMQPLSIACQRFIAVIDNCSTVAVAIQTKYGACANPNHEACQWKNVKRKTDKNDALKLAQLSPMNQLPTLQLPSAEVRQ